MTVIPMKRPAHVLRPAPIPEYVTFQPSARNALTALRARVGDLERIFAASAAPKAMADRVDALCAEILTEAARVRRFSR